VLANHQIVVVAAYLVGAESKRVDTEDIAVRANEIAPSRFTWRKYPDQINIEAVRKRLWDACKQDKGAYIFGSERDGWILTEAGVKFARANAEFYGDSKKRVSLNERTWLTSERARLLSTDAFRKYSDGSIDKITKRDAESFFRIDNYVQESAREEKILRILNAFGGDGELGLAVKKFAELVREGTISNEFPHDLR